MNQNLENCAFYYLHKCTYANTSLHFICYLVAQFVVKFLREIL